MKTTIFNAVCIAALSFLIAACQEPEVILSTREGNAINSITASFPGDDSMDNAFKSEIDYDTRTITVVFPYNYPVLSDIVVTEAMLSNVRMKANLENNVVIEPALLFMDLTRENRITVIDNSAGTSTEFKIVAKIRKSSECALTKFDLTAAGLSGVVNDSEKSVSFVTMDEIGQLTLSKEDFALSHGATISPDPSKVMIDYDQPQSFKVTAQDGETSCTYTVKKFVPGKVATGIRGGSGSLLWVKKLSEISSIASPMDVTSVAVSGDCLVLNERGTSKQTYLNSKTGEYVGQMDTPVFSSSNINGCVTSDEAGNIVFCNYLTSTGTFTIYKAASVNEPPSVFTSASMSSVTVGSHFSVKGSLDGNAVISVPVSNGKVAIWKVTGGVPESKTPTYVALPDETKGSGSVYSKWIDVIYTDESDMNSDFFLACHNRAVSDNTRHFYWCGGGTVKGMAPAETTSNTVQSAVDYKVFNNAGYVVYNFVNSFTWKVTPSDAVNLYDVSSGAFSTRIETVPSGTYGSVCIGAGANANAYGDVLISISKNGYYMYLYFVFAGGCVGCVQYDCIEM